ncbi:hypothetical protein IP81_18550 [Novosphingobium sp. AAP83]|nr:hypothetical protein IP81_18550 [Novosphingobium sp. AAP83]
MVAMSFLLKVVGDHPRWRQKKGPGAAVTAASAKGEPRTGLTALGETRPADRRQGGVVFAPPENEYQWAIAVFIDQKSEASSPSDHWMERSSNHPSNAANGRSRGVVTLDSGRATAVGSRCITQVGLCNISSHIDFCAEYKHMKP